MIEYALIVAGGTGERMQSSTPKQFLNIGGLPILIHTIKAFYHYSKELKIILVLPEKQFFTWHKLIEKHHFIINHQLVAGGNTRFESVRKGLEIIDGDGLVAIHDGVRPFISRQLISDCFRSANAKGSGVACVLPKDSIREIENTHNKSVDRSQYRLMQTPQTFKVALIKDAYSLITDIGCTDDASVAERAGQQIALVEGDYHNIKITTPEDIKIAQAIIDNLEV